MKQDWKKCGKLCCPDPFVISKSCTRCFSDKLAVVYGDHRVTYRQYHERCTRLASGLVKLGVNSGDVVATILPNIPAHTEAHFGVPACGAILNAINTRLDVNTVSYIFDHGGAKVALVDTQFIELAEAAIAQNGGTGPTLIEVPDAAAGFPQQDGTQPMTRCWRMEMQIFNGSCHRTNGKALR